MFGLIKKMFMGLLISIVNASNYTKCMLLRNQKCMIQLTLLNLHPNEYSQEIYYCLFAVKLDKCVRCFNALNDLSNKVCVPNKTEDLNLIVFNKITGINKSKSLTKDHANVNVDLMGKNVIQINGGTTKNVNVSVKNVMYVKNIVFEILLHFTFYEN